MPEIDAILQNAKSGEAASLLRRAVLNYPDWYVFLQEQDAREMLEGKKAKPKLFTDKDGRRHAFLFSDPAHVEAAQRLFGFDLSGESLRGSGEWAFRALSMKTDVVHLLGADGAHLQYEASELPGLLQASKEAHVEAALAALDGATAKLPEMLSRVCNFDSYWLALHHKESAMPILVEHQGKRRIAVFTAKDTLDAFLASQKHEQMMVLSQEGADLFLYISCIEGIDGVVFNCAGPITPRSFSRGFVTSVLKTNPGLIRKAAFRRLLTRSPFAFKPDELTSLTEEQNKEVLSLFYLSMLADGEVQESEYHFLQEVLTMLPWRWGVGQSKTLELASELRAKFPRGDNAKMAAEVHRLCASLSANVSREKLLVGLFAQMISDGDFVEKERAALQRYATLFGLEPEQAKRAISDAVKYLNTIVA